jgi:hypothetical protein
MRAGCLAVLHAALGGLLAGCAALGMAEPPPRVVSQPPTEMALETSLVTVARTVKWFGMVEASPVRQAHPLAPADWIVCAQSGARDLSPAYAMFFNGDSMVHFRIAVEIDDCRRAPYAPVTALVPDPAGPLLIGPHPPLVVSAPAR